MFAVILFVIIAIGFGFFSTQNSMPITLTFGDRVISQVPLYIVLGVTLLIGLLYSWLVNIVNSLFVSRRLQNKDLALNDLRKENEKLSQRLVELEMENTRLQAKIGNGVRE